MASPEAVNEFQKECEEVDRKYFDKLPPGCRFRPTGAELIVDYLRRKVFNLPMHVNRIRDVNLYNYHPQQLTNMFKLHREKEWYFFTPRQKRYPKGSRPARAAGNGYWKVTGVDTKIFSNGVIVGKKSSLVYFEGLPRDKAAKKTGWLMQEYTLATPVNQGEINPNDTMLDKWVLCIVYKNDRRYREEDRALNEVPNDIIEEETTTAIEVQASNLEADCNGEGVNDMVNFPMVNEQVPSEEQYWQYFNGPENVSMLNEQVPSEEQFSQFLNGPENISMLNEQVRSEEQLVMDQVLIEPNEEQWSYVNNYVVNNQQVINPNNGYTRFSSVHQSCGEYQHGQFDPVNPSFPFDPYDFLNDGPVWSQNHGGSSSTT